MESRSVRRRRGRRWTASPPPEKGLPVVQLHLRLQDIEGHHQSFLIMAGAKVAVTLNGYQSTRDGFRLIKTPIIIEANLA